MSESVSKSAKRPSSRPVTRSVSSAATTKNRKLSAKTTTARPQPLAKRSGAEKAPVLKATKNKTSATASSAKSAKKSSRAAAAANAKPKPTARPKALSAKPRAADKNKTSNKTAAKTPARTTSKSVTAAGKSSKRPDTPPATGGAATKKGSVRPALKPAAAARPHVPAPPRQPTLDEAAALRAFERAHKEFVRGRFAEARTQFRALIEQHSGVAEVTARARTYLAIAEARMRSESAMPRNAEELYDRGVIELNRGDFVAAQEMFERALKRDPEAAHIYYGLAATRARLGALEPALQSLGRALEIQPVLRVRAQHDPDLAPLRNEPEYERLIFASRP
jgi:tetratricopeptide (TPR) repeat protein